MSCSIYLQLWPNIDLLHFVRSVFSFQLVSFCSIEKDTFYVKVHAHGTKYLLTMKRIAGNYHVSIESYDHNCVDSFINKIKYNELLFFIHVLSIAIWSRTSWVCLINPLMDHGTKMAQNVNKTSNKFHLFNFFRDLKLLSNHFTALSFDYKNYKYQFSYWFCRF